MEKLVILDFNTGKVLLMNCSTPFDLDLYLETLEKDGVISSVNNCNWMLTKEDIIIK